jgi:hypothetical protein
MIIFTLVFFFHGDIFVGFVFLNDLKDAWHMPVSKLNVLQTLCYLLSTFLNYLDKHGGFGEDDQRNTAAPTSMFYEFSERQFHYFFFVSANLIPLL